MNSFDQPVESTIESTVEPIATEPLKVQVSPRAKLPCPVCGGRLVYAPNEPFPRDPSLPDGEQAPFTCLGCAMTVALRRSLGGWELEEEQAPETNEAQDAAPISAEPPRIPEPPKLSANPAFPSQPLPILRQSESRLKLRAALAGAALGIVSSLLIFLIAGKGSLLGEMFNLRRFSTVIPVIISCLFFWGALLCVWRRLRLRELERTSPKSLLLDATRVLSSEGLPELAAQLEHDDCGLSPLLRRLQAVARQWLLRPSLQDADLVLQQHVAHDEEAVHSGYGLLRTFVWALPVLGLIGTVVGISLAVGGFAQFLGGAIDDVAVVKQNLVGVTSGLSFAFLITLQGLLTSLLLMFAASSLQTREEKLHANIQQEIADIFLPALQRAAPEPATATETADPTAWREMLQQTANGVIETIRDVSRQAIASISEQQHAQHTAITGWTETWRRETESAAQRLGEASGRIGANLAAAGDGFLDRLAELREAMDQQAGALRSAVEAHVRGAIEQQAELANLASTQIHSVKAIIETLAGLRAVTQTALEQQAALQTSLQQFDGAKFRETFDRVAESLAEQSRQLQSAAGAVNGMSQSAQQTLAAQMALQTATQQLRDSDFTQTLAEFRDSLEALRPVLNSFHEPFVWRAIPMTARGQGED